MGTDKKGKDIIGRVIKVKVQKMGFAIDPSTTDNICSALASSINGENSYSDGYGQNKESSIGYALQRVLDNNPEIEVSGTFEVQGSCYYAEEKIETRDHIIVVISENGEEKTYVEKNKYDESAFLKAAMDAYPYKRFLATFNINGELFTKKDYKEFILKNVLYETTIFCKEGRTYEGFKMYIFLCVFDHDAVGIGESDYFECINKFYEAMPDKDIYLA